MAPSSSSLPFFLLSIFLLLSPLSNAQTPPKSFTFPITKDDSTNQYFTPITIGGSNSTTTFNAVIDLGGKFLWFNSIDYFNSASNYRPILCGTRECGVANGVGCVFCFNSPPVPGCTNNTCSDYALNPFTGTQGYSGLGQDSLHLSSSGRDGAHQYVSGSFPFQFSDPVLREGLNRFSAGLVGLGRTRISLPAQLSSSFKISQKFALCLPSSNRPGTLAIGDSGISLEMTTTPLVRNPASTFGNEVIGNFSVEYFVDLREIRVGGKTLSLNKTLLSIDRESGAGGTSLRTVRAYTTLHRSIYRALVDEFVRAMAAKKARRVAAVGPFGACFDSRTVDPSSVPEIDFVFPGKNVVWKFYGSNTMVSVGNGDVICLAFVEGSPNLTGPTTAVVVGGYQMENYLLEFDVGSSRLGISASLSTVGTSCSEFRAS